MLCILLLLAADVLVMFILCCWQLDVKLVMLVPELCYMTGLTDEMRSDFRIMKEVAQHTRIAPTVRQECLVKFVRNIQGNSLTQ